MGASIQVPCSFLQCQCDADGEWETGEEGWLPSEISPQMPPWGWLYFFQLSVFPKSFSMTNVYQCFPGAAAKELALGEEKQLAFLCEGPLSSEIMLFPKVRAHCCWVAARSSLPHSLWRWQQCTCVSFPDLCGNLRADIQEKKKRKMENQGPPLGRLHLPDCSISTSSVSSCLVLHGQGWVLLWGESAPTVPKGGDSRPPPGSGLTSCPWISRNFC